MKINWKVRVKNKYFWLALIPAVLLVAQNVAGWFGYDLPSESIGDKASMFVEAVFGLLVLLGITVDMTTDGVSDSRQALKYHEPKKEAKRP